MTSSWWPGLSDCPEGHQFLVPLEMTIVLRDCVSVQHHLEIGTEEDANIKDVLANLIGSKIELIE